MDNPIINNKQNQCSWDNQFSHIGSVAEDETWNLINQILKEGAVYQKEYVVDEIMKAVESSDEFKQNNTSFLNRTFIKDFVKNYYKEINKDRETEIYDCKRPLQGLNWLDDKGKKSLSESDSNPLYHEYLCVNINKKYVNEPYCNGQTTGFGLVGPGKPSNDKYVPEKCDKLEVAGPTACVPDCVDDRLKDKNRPLYTLVGLGTNCQEYVDMVLDSCLADCSSD